MMAFPDQAFFLSSWHREWARPTHDGRPMLKGDCWSGSSSVVAKKAPPVAEPYICANVAMQFNRGYRDTIVHRLCARTKFVAKAPVMRSSRTRAVATSSRRLRGLEQASLAVPFGFLPVARFTPGTQVLI